MDREPEPRIKHFRAEGYPKLGSYIGEKPEHAIFCSFRDLYAENLLYLQAEVVYLADELKRIQHNDSTITDGNNATDERSSYFQDWKLLRTSTEGEDSEQFRAIVKLRRALDKYYESLFRYEKILKMSQPKKKSMQEMAEWIERPSLGNIHIKSEDDGLYLLDPNKKRKPNHKAMVCLDDSTNNRDPLTAWITEWLVKPYHKPIRG
ncbi:hypothetical protein MFIFM68171_08374 [Madurella fahalii]|uniref:DUF6594 domain-containing protein n=1 Tax=Madurella fahalii TaxID=1157608 RepID=A0ABQ0GKE1_9PEZI